MKKLLAFTLLLCSSASLFGLVFDQSIGLKLGSGFSYVQNYDIVTVPASASDLISEDEKNKIKMVNDASKIEALMGGAIFYQIAFIKEIVGVRGEIGFQRRFLKKPIGYDQISADTSFAAIQTKSDAIDYVNSFDKATFDYTTFHAAGFANLPLIPLLMSLQVQAGLFTEILSRHENASLIIGAGDNEEKIDPERNQTGFFAGLGLDIKLPVIPLGIGVEGRYHYYMTTIWDSAQSDAKFHTVDGNVYARFTF